MQSVHAVLTILTLMSVAVTAGCDRTGYAGGGHDHGPTSAADPHGHGQEDGGELDPLSVTLFTSEAQLFVEYPRLYRGVHADFLAHVTVLATGDPVRFGSMTFNLTGPDGKRQQVNVNAPKRHGLFVPHWDFDTPGKYELQLVVNSPQLTETFEVGELIVHLDEHEAEEAADAETGNDLPNLVPFLLEQQWKIGTLYETVSKRTLVHRLAIPARIAAPQGASAAVSPPVSGRLLRPPDGRLPQIGDLVTAGQVLGVIEPQLSAAEIFELGANRAEIQALETELALRELELDTKALEVERSIVQAAARLEYARRAMERANELREKGVGTDRQHDEARQNLSLAQAEHEAAEAMKRFYKSARNRLAHLRERGSGDGVDPRLTAARNQMPLIAPITGEIVYVAHMEGEQLDNAHEDIFRIVNTDRIWVEADISEFDLDKIIEKPGATLTLPAYPGRSFDILNSGSGRLVNIGSIVDTDTRTVSVVYEMPNPERLFRVGMYADVYLETKTATEVLALPESAIVRDNGRETAFVLNNGESFQKRELELGIRDGGFVEVKSGIVEGERVVTKGAYSIKLASLSPASFGHGHGH